MRTTISPLRFGLPTSFSPMKVWVFTFVLLVGSSSRDVRAQDDLFSAENYLHSFWDISTGLPATDVRPIVQTPDGYIWVGSAEGLLRFNGHSFTLFNRANTPAMEAENVKSLVVDRDGRLWIGFFAGGVLTYSDGIFQKPEGGEPIDRLEIMSLVVDSSNAVYACTGRGVFRFQNGHGEYLRGLEEHTSNGAASRDGALYFLGRALTRWKDGTLTVLMKSDPRYMDPIYLSAGEDGSLLVGVYSGLLRLRFSPDGKISSRDSMPCAYVWASVPFGKERFLVGTRDDGVYALTSRGATRPRGFEALRNSARQVRNLLVDREGGIWLTTSGGLHRFRKSSIRLIDASSGLPVGFGAALYRSRDDVLWVSGTNAGTFRIPRSGDPRSVTSLPLPWERTTAFYESKRGELWLGGSPGGLAVRRNGRFVPVPGVPHTMDGTVFSIVEDWKDRMWIGTRAGLLMWKNGKATQHPAALHSKFSSVRNIQVSADSALWFIANGRVQRLRNDSLSTFVPANPPGFFPTIGLYVDTGAVWLGTYGSGVYLLRGDSIVDLRRVTDRLGPRVLSILEDDVGYLWVNAERSLQRVNKREILRALESPGGRVHVQVFDYNDGLQNVEFNHVSKSSSQKLPDGKLMYASLPGVVIVDPSSVAPRPPIPTVRIEAIIADGSRHDATEGLTIPTGTRRLEFAYTALYFDAPSRARFRVNLAGFDPQPIERDGSDRTVSYTNPTAGSYTFTVAASLDGEEWSATPASVTFEVAPFFHQTWWFRIGGLLFVVGGLWGGYAFRTRSIRARNRALEKEITQRREAEAALRESEARAHQLVREVQASLLEKTVMLKEIHHRVKNNMQVVSSLISLQVERTEDAVAREALGESRQRIRSMALVHEALYRTENLASIGFREYLEKLIRHITLSHSRPNLRIQFEGSDIALPVDQAIPAGLLMNELISNTFKHAFPNGAEGNVTVSLQDCGDNVVEMSVRDDGVGLPLGFELRQAATLGLQLVVTLTEQLEGEIHVGGGSGTSISVRFRRL